MLFHLPHFDPDEEEKFTFYAEHIRGIGQRGNSGRRAFPAASGPG
jgi:hypothetical protein